MKTDLRKVCKKCGSIYINPPYGCDCGGYLVWREVPINAKILKESEHEYFMRRLNIKEVKQKCHTL